MQIRDGIVDAIGHTPLIKLERASAATGCTILGKAEFMNPGRLGEGPRRPPDDPGSREARRIAARRPGGRGDRRQYRHRPGAGRQCARLSHADRHSADAEPGKEGHAAAVRRRTGRGAGAALQQSEQLPACRPAAWPSSCKKTEKNGVIFADQWNNLDNRKAHYVSTGPEIWQQTGGKIDGFICAIGTGGTLAGVSSYLREKKKDIVIGCADPRGAAMYNLFAHGEAKASEGGSITEGIGLGRVTPIVEDIKVDKAYLIPDEEAVPIIFDLLAARRALPRRLLRHQCRRRHPARQGPRPRPHHRDGAVRLRHALPVQAVQSGIPALEKSAGAGLAGAQDRDFHSVREDVSAPCPPTACSATTPI